MIACVPPVHTLAFRALVLGGAFSLLLPSIALAQGATSIITCGNTFGIDLLTWGFLGLHESGDQNPGIFRISGDRVAEWDGVTHAYVDLCSSRFVTSERVVVGPTTCAVEASTIRYSWSGSVRADGTTVTRTWNFFIDRATGAASLDKIYDWTGDLENHAQQSYSGSCKVTADPAATATKF